MRRLLKPYTRRTRWSIAIFKWALIGVILVYQSIDLHAQNNQGPAFYTNVNAGLGKLYGGFGGSLEAGLGHFSTFGSIGYATQRKIDTITIQPTVNYHVGLRYYFDVNSNIIFPRVGIGYGWITNYYSDKIGNQSYSQHVTGLSLHAGVQFYTLEGIVFSFDVSAGSKYTISNESNHPHFYTVYIRPNIGIGYDLTKLLTGKAKVDRVKNDAINPFNP